MPSEGDIVLARIPNTDLTEGKKRPVVLIKPCPSYPDDWVVCVVSSQLHQAEAQLDIVIDTEDSDFGATGLTRSSVIRVTRLAVADESLLVGSIGNLSPARLSELKNNLSNWIAS